METASSRQELPENQQKCTKAFRTVNQSKQWNVWTRMAMVFEGSRTREGMACWDAQAQRAIGTILFVTFETLKTYEHANIVVQTRASGKLSEMPRCFRNTNILKQWSLWTRMVMVFKASWTRESRESLICLLNGLPCRPSQRLHITHKFINPSSQAGGNDCTTLVTRGDQARGG